VAFPTSHVLTAFSPSSSPSSFSSVQPTTVATARLRLRSTPSRPPSPRMRPLSLGP
jgi:hypothetical protein